MGPASYNYDESMTTLRYANRAKNIKNIPKINEDPKDAKMREYKDEIDKLKKQLAERGIGKWFLILSNFFKGVHQGIFGHKFGQKRSYLLQRAAGFIFDH